MRLSDFETLVRRLVSELPPDFLDGIAEVAVSPKSVPDPTRADVYTLGECIPLPAAADQPAGGVQSRIVLYHGSFQNLARLDADFDWREEAWETLTHELRHHVEWRARAPALEAFDRAAEQNFARHDGERFDPSFYLDGNAPAPDVYEIDGDYFLDRTVRAPPARLELEWHGANYEAPVPAGLTLPAFLTIDGVDEPPPGDLILVLRRRPWVGDLFRRGGVFSAAVRMTPGVGPPSRRQKG